MTSSQSQPKSIVQDSLHFRSETADFILLSTEGINAAGVKEPSCRFRVHRDKLLAASPVFAGMLSLGEMQDKQSKASDLPFVQLTETTAILDIVLRSIYHDISAITDFQTIAAKYILKTFEAATKYDLVKLQVLTEILIRFNIASFSPKHALTLLDRACVFKRKRVAADAARVYVAKVNTLTIEESILSHLPAEALLLLITEQNLVIERIRARDYKELAVLENRIELLSLQPRGNILQSELAELQKDMRAYRISTFP